VEANNAGRSESAKELKPMFISEPDSRVEDAKVFRQPTAEEMSRLVFAQLRDSCVHEQEARNYFARLLNRGSSLE